MSDDEFYTATEAAFRLLPHDDPATLAIGVVLAYTRMLRKNASHGVEDVSVFRSMRQALCAINDLITSVTEHATYIARDPFDSKSPSPTRRKY